MFSNFLEPPNYCKKCLFSENGLKLSMAAIKTKEVGITSTDIKQRHQVRVNILTKETKYDMTSI